MCRIQDCDPWKVYRAGTRVARKEHTCFECGRKITKGESYHYATGLHPDAAGWDVFKLCPHCDAASQWLVVVCNGFLYGGIREELREHWEEEWELRSIGLGRLIHGIERRWQRTKYATGLMEIPTYAKTVARTSMAPIKAAERASVARQVVKVEAALAAAVAAGNNGEAEFARRQLMHLGYQADRLDAEAQAS